MCSRKERIEELNQSLEILRKQIQEKQPVKNMHDAFRLIMPDLDNRPKEVPLELWKNYIKVIDEMTTLSIEQWTEEWTKDFVNVKDIGKIRGLRAQCKVIDDYYNLGEIDDTDI